MGFVGRYVFQIVGALVAVAYLIIGVFESTNSTASIGFLFIPVAILIGVFVGDALKYLFDIIRGKRTHSPRKTILILIVLSISSYKFFQTQMHERALSVAKNPSTSSAELINLLQKNNKEITYAVVANPSLPIAELEKITEENLHDYYIISGAIQNPNLTPAKIEQIIWLERNDFNADAEYEVYQTYVWASLASRKDLPEVLIHKLADKENIGHFLILALLKSPYTSCEEKLRFLPQNNEVLEDAIHRSMKSQNCPL